MYSNQIYSRNLLHHLHFFIIAFIFPGHCFIWLGYCFTIICAFNQCQTLAAPLHYLTSIDSSPRYCLICCLDWDCFSSYSCISVPVSSVALAPISAVSPCLWVLSPAISWLSPHHQHPRLSVLPGHCSRGHPQRLIGAASVATTHANEAQLHQYAHSISTLSLAPYCHL